MGAIKHINAFMANKTKALFKALVAVGLVGVNWPVAVAAPSLDAYAVVIGGAGNGSISQGCASFAPLQSYLFSHPTLHQFPPVESVHAATAVG